MRELKVKIWLTMTISFKYYIISSVRSSYSHPDLLLIHPPHHPLFQITPVLNTGLSLSEPLQLYQRQSLHYVSIPIEMSGPYWNGMFEKKIVNNKTKASKAEVNKILSHHYWEVIKKNGWVADVIISQVVLAGEICFKRGKRDTGRDAEEKYTEKTRQDMIVIYLVIWWWAVIIEINFAS